MVVICQVVVSQAFNPSTWDAVRQISEFKVRAWSMEGVQEHIEILSCGTGRNKYIYIVP
jgi:hypothetical protein